MASILDIAVPAPLEPPGLSALPDWEQFAALWNGNDLAAAHDWLNQRWAILVANRIRGHEDPEARFLQGIAFATLALFFTQSGNQEGALLMLDDALVWLGRYRPRFLGVEVDPILDSLQELRPMILGLAPDAECPMQPFVYRRFEYHR